MFSITQIPLSWSDYFLMITLVTFWVIGFSMVTQKGKILYFFREFFEKKNRKRFAANQEGNNRYDAEMLAYLFKYSPDFGYNDYKAALIKQYLLEAKVEVDVFHKELFKTALRTMETSDPTANKYFFWRDTERLSWKITDPIITCPTCMPSLHGALIYLVACYYMNWVVNPLIWVAIAVPCCYFTTVFWLIFKILKKKSDG